MTCTVPTMRVHPGRNPTNENDELASTSFAPSPVLPRTRRALRQSLAQHLLADPVREFGLTIERLGVAVAHGSRRAVDSDPCHHLGVREVPRNTAHLQMPSSGRCQSDSRKRTIAACMRHAFSLGSRPTRAANLALPETSPQTSS